MARLTILDDAKAFLARATPFLLAREAQNNLLFGLSETIIRLPDRYAQHVFAVLEGDAGIEMCALMTPPHPMTISHGAEESARALAAALHHDGVAVGGVSGEVGLARAFAAEWCARGAIASTTAGQRIYRLDRVRAPSGVPGSARKAAERDLALVAEWLTAFSWEIGSSGAAMDDPEATARRFIDGHGCWIWEDGGPCSMTCCSGETPTGIRISAVYTPPERRGRGYASALVAEVSELQLRNGRRYCFLFADRENPTSNHIYRQIGYEPVCDVDIYRFDPA